MTNFENTASSLSTEPLPELKAWRYEMICKLISSGVTNPDELIKTTTKIYTFIVSPKVLPTHRN